MLENVSQQIVSRTSETKRKVIVNSSLFGNGNHVKDDRNNEYNYIWAIDLS